MFDLLRPHESLLSWAIFGLVLIGLTVSVSNAFLDTTVWQLEAQRYLSGPVVRRAADTLSWKVYLNEKFGFEFQYPSKWGEVKLSGGVISRSSEQAYVVECEPTGQWFRGEFSANGQIVFDARSTDFNDCSLGRGGALSDFTKFKVQGNTLIFSSYYEPQESVAIERVVPTVDGGAAYVFKNFYCEGCEGGPAAVASLRDKSFSLIFFETGYEYDFVAKVLEDKILSTFKLIEQIDTSTWKTYRNTQGRFELRYPPTWFVYPGSTWVGLQSADARKNIHGVGFPAAGEMWITISNGDCPTAQNDFVPSEVGPNTYILEKTVCRDGFPILLGLWDADPTKEQHKRLLEAVAATFRRL